MMFSIVINYQGRIVLRQRDAIHHRTIRMYLTKEEALDLSNKLKETVESMEREKNNER